VANSGLRSLEREDCTGSPQRTAAPEMEEEEEKKRRRKKKLLAEHTLQL
jgi:hypothetical protein